ncbi:hypothetical protein ACQEVZ_49550 [Dactylosporangium sp. CA-152071]|uniref:hypothetical protein n=1 Tax=Dactylosporangium sp. CA-152071 TaxID=3239933 RepID=UPI003D931E43
MAPWLRLGIRLTFAGGRRAWARMALMASGTAIGAVLLLGALAVPGVIEAQDHRETARDIVVGPGDKDGGTRFTMIQDSIGGRELVRFAVAAIGSRDPQVPPGLAKVPLPDQAVVSPALAELIRTDPRARARFPQRIVGTIGPAGLVAPDELRAWVGVDPAALADAPVIIGFGPRGEPPVPWAKYYVGEWIVTTVLTVFLLFPLGALLAACSGVAPGVPSRRSDTLHRLGASRRQVELVAAAETGVVSALGALLGTGVFLLLLRPLSGGWHLGRFHWFATDVRTPPAMIAAVVAGLTLLAVHIDDYSGGLPLPRDTPAPRPTARRLLTPVLGVASAASVLVPGLPFAAQAALFGGGVLLCAAGLPAAVPVLTAWLGRRLATVGPVPARLAGRRLDHTPSHAPRHVASVAVALFLSVVGLAAAAGHAEWTGPSPRNGTPLATYIVFGPTAGLTEAPGVDRVAGSSDDGRQTVVALSTDPADAEAFAAYLAAHLPATYLQRPGDLRPVPLGGPLESAHGFDRSAGLVLPSVTLAVAALLAGAAFGVGAIERFLQHRRRNARLLVVGAPWRTVAAAEFLAAAVPLIVALALAGACAGVVLAAWTGTLSLSTSDVLGATAPALWVAAALLGVLAAIAPAAVRRRATATDLRRA